MMVDRNGKIPFNLAGKLQWLQLLLSIVQGFSNVLFSQGSSPMAVTPAVLTVHELAVWKPWPPKLRAHLLMPAAMQGLPARHPLPREKYGTSIWKEYKTAFKCWIKRTEIFLALHSEWKGFDSGIFLWQCFIFVLRIVYFFLFWTL